MFQVTSPDVDGKFTADALIKFLDKYENKIKITAVPESRNDMKFAIHITADGYNTIFVLAPFLESFKIVNITIGDSDN